MGDRFTSSGGGTATQTPAGEMTKTDVVAAIQEIEAQHLSPDVLRELQPFWARLNELGSFDTS